MGLTGTFVPNNELTVHVWEPPDKNGNGPRHVVQKQNEDDGSFYWEDVEDSDGNPVFRYEPPEGFENHPSRDEMGRETENYVLKERGAVVRDKKGNALSVVPGGAAVIHPDGTHESIPPKELKKFLGGLKQV